MWCTTPIETFFPRLKTVFELIDFYAFYVSALFCFTSSTLANISLWRLFSSRETKKSCSGQVRLGKQGGWGTGVMQLLLRNCWTLGEVWAGALVNHPTWNGQTHWKSLQKKFTEAERSLSQHCQLVHWYRWVLRTLTQPGKPVLQGTCPPEGNSGLFGVPFIDMGIIHMKNLKYIVRLSSSFLCCF